MEERFWSKVDKTATCWNWNGYLLRGYGRFKVGDTTRIVHRFAYEYFVGKIPRNKVIDHLCRNRKCVNPAHLEVVTMRENVLRGEGPAAINARKTQCPKGHPLTKSNLDLYCLNQRGHRMCRICKRKRSREFMRGKYISVKVRSMHAKRKEFLQV